MVKHTQTIRYQQPTNCLSLFGHFVEFAPKGLKTQIPPYLTGDFKCGMNEGRCGSLNDSSNANLKVIWKKLCALPL